MTPRQYVMKHREETLSEEQQLFDMFQDFCETKMCFDCPSCPFFDDSFQGCDSACEDDEYWQNVAFEKYCDYDFREEEE